MHWYVHMALLATGAVAGWYGHPTFTVTVIATCILVGTVDTLVLKGK